MDRPSKVLVDLEAGILPKELDFSLDFNKSIEDKIIFKTYTKELAVQKVGYELLEMFPSLYNLVEEVFGTIKDKTPLLEMEIREKNNIGVIESSDIINAEIID